MDGHERHAFEPELLDGHAKLAQDILCSNKALLLGSFFRRSGHRGLCSRRQKLLRKKALRLIFHGDARQTRTDWRHICIYATGCGKPLTYQMYQGVHGCERNEVDIGQGHLPESDITRVPLPRSPEDERWFQTLALVFIRDIGSERIAPDLADQRLGREVGRIVTQLGLDVVLTEQVGHVVEIHTGTVELGFQAQIDGADEVIDILIVAILDEEHLIGFWVERQIAE